MGRRRILTAGRGRWLPFAGLTRKPSGSPNEASGSAIGFAVPSQQPYSPEIFDVRPKEVRRWVEDLPLANVGQTGRLLYQALVSTNGMDIPAKARLDLLEALREPTSSVMQSLRRHYVGTGFPLPEKSRNAAKLDEAMCRAMAAGYESATRDLLLGRSYASSRRVALAIHRSVRYLGQVLLANYHAYAPGPAGTWLEIHQLFLQAERQGIDDKRVQDDTYGLAKRGTVADAYKQVLMLGLTDPYRLPQPEIENVYVAIERWSPLATLRPCGEHPGRRAFMVNLAKDQAPLAFSFQQEPLDTCRILDATEVIPDVEEEARRATGHHPVAATPADGMAPGDFLSEATLARLLASWDNRSERRAQRVGKSSPVSVVRGLSAIHQFLLDLKETAGRPVREVVEYEPVSRLGMPLQLPEVEEVEHSAHPAAWAEPGRAQPDLALYECRTLDESIGGCRLRWGTPELGGIRAGELLLANFPEQQPGSRYRLGVVRWMRQEHGERPETGVQWLASKVLPVWTEPAQGPPGKQEFLRALVLPERAIDGYAFALVTGALSYRPGHEVTVRNDASDKVYRLASLVEQTAAYAHFQVTAVDRPGPEARQGTQPARRDDFETLWETL
jgi:cyclic-di-GMP-binding protein